MVIVKSRNTKSNESNFIGLLFVISCLFDNSHSNRCEVISHCGLDLHLPGD